MGTTRVASPGDLYYLPFEEEKSDVPPIEWAVIQIVSGQAMVIPADENRMRDSTDVSVAEIVSGQPRTLRCRLFLWIPIGAFGRGKNIGLFDASACARILRQVQAVEFDPTFFQAVAGVTEELIPDEDRSWRRVLDAAQESLRRRFPAGA